MAGSLRRLSALHVRVAIYMAVILVLFLVRGGVNWRQVRSRLNPGEPAMKTLTVAGSDLAPGLVNRVLADFRDDYPGFSVEVRGGGTARALEDLGNREADVAFLDRPPTAGEQEQFRRVLGDSVLAFPVALDAIVILRARGADAAPVDSTALAEFLRTGAGAGWDRLYAPDPNQGLWDALRTCLGLAPAEGTGLPAGAVVFLADRDQVMRAVAADSAAIGIAGSLALPSDLAARGVAPVRVRRAPGDPAAPPTFEAVGYGEYPLHHLLYVASLAGDDGAGSMFVTAVTGARGQRRIERAGYLPARRPLREIVVTRRPVGAAG